MPPSEPPPFSANHVVGVVLAGGAGRRMGEGPPKPLRMLGGRPLVAHAVAALRPSVSTRAISARDVDRYRFLGLPVIADDVPPSADGRPPGPLAGILAALAWAKEHAPDARWLLAAPADTPFLPADLAARLIGAGPGADVVAVARRGGREHYAVGLWPLAAGPALRRVVVAGGVRSVGDGLRLLGYRAVDWPADGEDPFFNVNTPADLECAEAILRDRRG